MSRIFFRLSMSFLLGVLALPFTSVGVGFEDPHLRLISYLEESGFSSVSLLYSYYTAHDSSAMLLKGVTVPL